MNRIIPGLLLALCWLLLLLSGSFTLFYLVIILLSFIGGNEYLRMVMPQETDSSTLFMLTASLALPVILAGHWYEDGLSGGLLFSVFLSICFVLLNYSRLNDSYAVLTRLVFGAVYVGFLTAHLLLLWHLPEGNYWLIILVAITAGSDSGAYYSGKNFGKHKLSKHISPNKTIEGAVGGILAGVITAVLFAVLLLDSVNWIVLIPMAILLTVVGIVGDLCESVVKRGTDTKDSGKLLLGHGGILDRIDSMILAAPLLYYLLVYSG